MSDYKRRKLDELYATLPTVDCKGLCHECCGPVLMSREEWVRIKQRLGRTPVGRADLRCPMLTADNKCSVHDIRPTICRLWGAVPEMPCPHGCKPSRVMPKAEQAEAIHRAAAIGA